jgi:hypothetical protein
MGGGCKIISFDCIAQSAKKCQEGKAKGHCKEGMVEQRSRHDRGETIALDGPKGCYPYQSFTGALRSLLAVGFELA